MRARGAEINLSNIPLITKFNSMSYNINASRIRSLILAFLLLLIPVMLGCEGLLEQVTYDTCPKLAPDIVELSEGNNNMFGSSILKIYDIEEVRKDLPDNLHCRGNAKFSSGFDQQIIFDMTTDQDGDKFISYEAVE